MKRARFVTAQELDPFTAISLNTRFNSFLAAFAARLGYEDFDSFMATAREILSEGEIPQD